MKRRPLVLFRYFPPLALIILGLVWGFSVALTATGESPQATQNLSATPSVKPVKSEGIILPTVNHTEQDKRDNYVGNDTCLTCHEEQGKGIDKTLHGHSADSRTPAAKADRMCETCHGPGKAHSESGAKKDIRSFKALSASAANETCMSCHENQTSHINWNGSMHSARNVKCADCHSVHSSKSKTAQLKTARVSETCVSCHTDKALKIRKSSHMPLHEGKMECTSCHSPHGSNGEKMLKVGFTVNESCVSCHTEKRGPFLWEHAPVSNNCVTCHEPHGTNNVSLLRQRLPFLCQGCHVNTRHPPTIYDGNQVANASNRVLGSACVNCHSQIHGSNHPAGNRFLR